MKVAIFIIATGGYIKNYESLKLSIEKYFLTNHEKHFYVYTDDKTISNTNDASVIYTQPLPWPLPSLLRFHLLNKTDLIGFDLAYYFDADTYLVDHIHDEVIPDESDGLVGVLHPRNLIFKDSSFDTNEQSTAYVKSGDTNKYVQGSFFGGRIKQFVKMCVTLQNNINIDLNKNIIAKWYDESHINKYFVDNPPKYLDCGYAKPDFWNMGDSIKRKIIHISKDHSSERGLTNNYSKGICLVAIGDPCFAKYAYNFAASVKYVDKTAKFCVITHGDCLKSLGDKIKIFDHIKEFSDDDLYFNRRLQPNRTKLLVHKYTPFDYTICVDVDTIWFSRLKISQLFDNFISDNIEFVPECRKTTIISDNPVVFSALNVTKCIPPLDIKNKKAYQLHGQFLLFKNSDNVKKFFEESLRIFNLIELGQLKNTTCYWQWKGRASEEMSMTLAAVTTPLILPTKCESAQFMITQEDNIFEIDDLSTKKLMLTINGVESYDKAKITHGYVCVKEEITTRYIDMYNNIVTNINSNSDLDLFLWQDKKYDFDGIV